MSVKDGQTFPAVTVTHTHTHTHTHTMAVHSEKHMGVFQCFLFHWWKAAELSVLG